MICQNDCGVLCVCNFKGLTFESLREFYCETLDIQYKPIKPFRFGVEDGLNYAGATDGITYFDLIRIQHNFANPELEFDLYDVVKRMRDGAN